MMFKSVILCFLLVGMGCASTKNMFKPSEKLTLFNDMLEGVYNSSEQAAMDSDYLNISLVMKRIWTDRTDGYWLYVEQALTAKPEKPYRQRVYQLIQKGENTFISRVYQFNDPLLYAGAHKDTTILKKLSFDKLTTKEGCDVIMNKYGTSFEGGTKGKNCASSLKGATYATSEIILEAKVLKSWDRGFDEEDKQVWGAEKGPYLFKRISTLQLQSIERKANNNTQ